MGFVKKLIFSVIASGFIRVAKQGAAAASLSNPQKTKQNTQQNAQSQKVDSRHWA